MSDGLNLNIQTEFKGIAGKFSKKQEFVFDLLKIVLDKTENFLYNRDKIG